MKSAAYNSKIKDRKRGSKNSKKRNKAGSKRKDVRVVWSLHFS